MGKAGSFNKVIGIIGGGQLGKMLIEAAQPWNTRFIILEKETNAPASASASGQILGDLYNPDKIRDLASLCDTLTYEIEHLGVETLLELEAEGFRIIPSPKILNIINDKGLQKMFYRDHGLPTSGFRLVNSPAEWLEATESFTGSKLVAKSRTGGYDGKGVAILAKEQCRDINSLPFQGPTVLEEFVDCARELSVIVARSESGETVSFPLVEMEFDPVANLVNYLFSPAMVDQHITEEASSLARSCVEKLEGFGLFAVEMFLTMDNKLLINEIAPRPHNSGHHTIEACVTSQYEQLNRILLGLPLGKTDLIQPAVMINLLGPSDFTGSYSIENLDEILTIPGVYIHLYGKIETRPMRKMGHITILGETLENARHKAAIVQSLFKFVPDKR